MNALSPAGPLFTSLESNNATNVRGLVGGGVTYVSRQTSATCGWNTWIHSVSRHASMYSLSFYPLQPNLSVCNKTYLRVILQQPPSKSLVQPMRDRSHHRRLSIHLRRRDAIRRTFRYSVSVRRFVREPPFEGCRDAARSPLWRSWARGVDGFGGVHRRPTAPVLLDAQLFACLRDRSCQCYFESNEKLKPYYCRRALEIDDLHGTIYSG